MGQAKVVIQSVGENFTLTREICFFLQNTKVRKYSYLNSPPKWGWQLSPKKYCWIVSTNVYYCRKISCMKSPSDLAFISKSVYRQSVDYINPIYPLLLLNHIVNPFVILHIYIYDKRITTTAPLNLPRCPLLTLIGYLNSPHSANGYQYFFPKKTSSSHPRAVKSQI